MIEKKKCTYGLFYCLYELIKYVPNLIWSMYSFLYIIVEYMCVHVCTRLCGYACKREARYLYVIFCFKSN